MKLHFPNHWISIELAFLKLFLSKLYEGAVCDCLLPANAFHFPGPRVLLPRFIIQYKDIFRLLFQL